MLIVAGAIILLAAVVHAVTGFGFALVATPLLALTVDPHTAVVATTLAALAMTVTVAVRQRHHAEWKVAAIALVGTVLGMPLGLLVYRMTSERLLTGLIGLGVLVCVVLVWRGTKIRGTTPTVAGVGLIAGALSTSTGTNGPPVVAAFQGMGYDPPTFRATLAVVFGGTSVLSLLLFVAAGEVNADALWIGLIGVPTVQLGYWLGNPLFNRIDPKRFRTVVLVALLVSAAVTLAAAFAG
jgi:uncharacterized membrane protein YfcA